LLLLPSASAPRLRESTGARQPRHERRFSWQWTAPNCYPGAQPVTVGAILPRARLDETTEQPLESALERVFGFSTFRPGQREVVEALLAGEDVLAVMPTGGGKSLCYQLPAVLKPGLTLVVSPLIALMDNQVAQLRLLGIEAAAVHSGVDRGERARIWQAIKEQRLKLLYLSPELLGTERLQAALDRLPVEQIIVDEVHCVSQWGHDFRPDYRTLASLPARYPGAGVAGFTATADRVTREDITSQLFRDRQPRVFVHGFDRPNIKLTVLEKERPERQLLDTLARFPGQQGIVYRLARKATEETAANLGAAGHRAVAYHAGLDGALRKELLDRFLTEPDLIVVATIAFGMGIDKPDIRFVVHLDLPGNLEAYYQEIGRAGRDGQPAEAIMLYGFDDIRRRRWLIENGTATEAQKRVEHRRLDALLAFTETSGCRKQALLGYFGETAPPCGSCDRCVDPPDLADATALAIALLSAIRATDTRFGQAHLIDILIGETTAKVAQFGHDRLAVFGAAAGMDKRVLRGAIRQLYASGVIEVDIAGHGALRPGRRAEAITAGGETIALDLSPPRKKPAKARKSANGATAPAASLDPADADLLRALKVLRLEIAKEIDKPAYVVFSDATLADMARKRPLTAPALLSVDGVGETKRGLYGDRFIEVIGRFAG
jgi:ATP-dependent DNA helicase RecQ